MITKEECRSIVNTALDHGKNKADGLEVVIVASDKATSRFANNGMTQNQAPYCVSISARAIVDGRQARLWTDNIGPDDIRKLVDNAIEVARLLEKDPKLLPMLPPINGKSVDRFDAGTAAGTADRRADHVKSIINVAKQKNLTSAGTVSSGSGVEAIGNSAGLFQFYQGSEMGSSMTMKASDSTGWAKQVSSFARDIDAQAMANTAAEKAIASADPIEIDPGHYTVILEPAAVLDLMGGLWYDFSATSHIDKLSCFLNQVGQKVLGTNITIFDDVYHPLQRGAPFDGEGMPRQKVCLVDKGVIKNLVYGRRAAKELGAQPTGHGMMEPNSRGEHVENIVIEGGDTSLEEMIRTTDRGVLLTRVWYVREVDPSKKIVTGMTRDGTFFIEDGKIKKGVKNLRFNEGILDMLNRVIQLGPAVRTAGEESFSAVVPPMKVAYFNFESTTKF